MSENIKVYRTEPKINAEYRADEHDWLETTFHLTDGEGKQISWRANTP